MNTAIARAVVKTCPDCGDALPDDGKCKNKHCCDYCPPEDKKCSVCGWPFWVPKDADIGGCQVSECPYRQLRDYAAGIEQAIRKTR